MTQMGGVQEENHLVALFPPGGLHVHCPGELAPLITTISIGIKLPQKCSAKQTYNLVIKFVGDVRTRQRSLGLKDLIVGWTVLLSSELLRGTGWEGAGKEGYVGEQGCLRRKDGSANLFLDNSTCLRRKKEQRTKTEGQEEILAATGPQKQKP